MSDSEMPGDELPEYSRAGSPAADDLPPDYPAEARDENDLADDRFAESSATEQESAYPADTPAGAEQAEPRTPLLQPVRSYRLTSLVAGILFIALSIILVWPVFSGGYILLPGIIVAIVIAGIALSLLAYWLNTGRQARGALFLALLALFWAALTGIFTAESSVSIGQDWPLYLLGLGGAILVTFLGDRQHDRRLILPGLIVTVAGLTALLVTGGTLSPDVIASFRQASPWILVILAALGLLSLAIRRIPPSDQGAAHLPGGIEPAAFDAEQGYKERVS